MPDRLPRPTSIACMSHNINNFVIDPEGRIYNCFHHVGMAEKAIGIISENIDYGNENFKRLFDFDPFADKECAQCTVLPSCMGGCPVMRIERGITGEGLCGNWKHNLGPMLEIIARSKYQEYMKKIEEGVPA